MSFFAGFSECGWPSETCHVWWEAWAAVGTLLAAIITLLAVVTALKTSRDALAQAKALENERRESAQRKDHRSAEAICGALLFETKNSLGGRQQILELSKRDKRTPFDARTLIIRLGLDTRAILRIAANRADVLPSDIANLVFQNLAAVEALHTFVRPMGQVPDNIEPNQIGPIYDTCYFMGNELNRHDEALIAAIGDAYPQK